MQREVWSCCCKLLRNLGFKKETTAFFFLIWQRKSVGFWVCKIWFTVSVNRCHWSALVGPQETHAFGENWVKLKSSVELGRYKCQLRIWSILFHCCPVANKQHEKQHLSMSLLWPCAKWQGQKLILRCLHLDFFLLHYGNFCIQD